MLRRNQNIEELNKKCELLEQMGFTINHRDCDVSFETINTRFEDFDFSAVAPHIPAILYTALHHVYKLGVQKGREMNQQALRNALGIEE